MFILIAESKAAFLETVISRCTVLTLSAPTFREGRELLSSKFDYGIDDIENALNEARNNIGTAINLLKGKADCKINAAAKEFLGFAMRGDGWEMLSALAPFEKSRGETDELFKALKLFVAEEIRKNPKSTLAPGLMKFYDEITRLEASLITNINLPLLFSDLTAVAKKCLI